VEIVLPYIVILFAVVFFGHTKGRGISTFIVSLLLSPLIGLIWALLVADHKVKQCPICKEDVKIDALRCKHCGANLTE